MSKPAPPQYKTTNWPTYNRALRRRGSLTIWLDRDMLWRAPLTGKAGRNPTFSDAAIQFCLTIKGLFGLPLRQTTGFVESLLVNGNARSMVRNTAANGARFIWGIDAQTLEIRAIEVTDNRIGDASMLPELLR